MLKPARWICRTMKSMSCLNLVSYRSTWISIVEKAIEFRFDNEERKRKEKKKKS